MTKSPPFHCLLFAVAMQLSILHAQIRVYDRQRDAIAQQALEHAKAIESGTLFEKQSRNARALAAQDVAVMLQDAKTRARGNINAFRAWSDLLSVAQTVSASSQVETLNQLEQVNALAALQAQRDSIKLAITELQATTSGSNELELLSANLGKVDSTLELGQKLIDAKDRQGIQEVRAVLSDLTTLLTNYRTQMAAVNAAITKFNSLKVNVQKALLQRLKVEEDYLLSRAALYDRREAELGPIRGLVKRCVISQGVDPDEAIATTLEKLRTEALPLQRAVRILYSCSSLAARSQIPNDLYRVRIAQLEHMKSIQLSAANARVYESVLGGGVERLALFYQGGVRPETLAQVIQSLSTTGIFGKLLTQ